LRELPEGYGLRGAEDTQEEDIPFRIIPARERYTRLAIELPDRSKSGFYVVRVQESVGLSTVVGSGGTSTDGIELQVSLDLRNVPPSGYMICITREDNQARDAEYLGHYPVVIGGESKEKSERVTR
jgi:hypothetical protein